MASQTCFLLALSIGILSSIPDHLVNIRISRKCHRPEAASARYLTLCSSASPRLVPRLAVASSRTLSRPDPYFIVAATVKQLGYWTLLNENNINQLCKALNDGIGGLFDLCVEKAGLTMDDIRRLVIALFPSYYRTALNKRMPYASPSFKSS